MNDDRRSDTPLAYEQFHRCRPGPQPASPSGPVEETPRPEAAERLAFTRDRFAHRFEKDGRLW